MNRAQKKQLAANGAKGGESMSAKKREAARKNLMKARLVHARLVRIAKRLAKANRPPS